MFHQTIATLQIFQCIIPNNLNILKLRREVNVSDEKCSRIPLQILPI